MARIVGVDLPDGKHIEIALTYIYGIGRSSARKILEKANIPIQCKTRDLTEEQTVKIRDIIENDYKILISVGPSYLYPGITISFDIAYVCGNGLEDMIKNAAQAKMVYDGTWYNADGDHDTGIFGRETPVLGPLKEYDPDGSFTLYKRAISFKGGKILVEQKQNKHNNKYMIVYGYLKKSDIPENYVDRSDIEIIPEEDYKKVSRKLRREGLEGVINFWD